MIRTVLTVLTVLTVAVVVAAFLGALALVRRATAVGRARLVGTALLLLWFGLAFALSWFGFFVPSSPPMPVPPLALTLLPTLALALALVSSPTFRRRLDAIPAPALVRVQLYRVSGALVLAQYLAGTLPAGFALPTGLGSLAVGVGAPFVARQLEPRDVGAHGRRLALAWNAVGLAELFAALLLGAATAPSHPQLVHFPMVAIAAFVVPLSLFLHLASLRACLRLDAVRAAGEGAAA